MRGSRRFVRFVWALIAATGLVTVGAVAAWMGAMAQHQHAPSMEGMQKPDWLGKLVPAARREAIQKKDAALFKERIETLRASCSACHAAEKHAFIKIAVPTVRRNPIEKP